jgi:4-hydroxy-4-methyl-2-oxoglutarate aldolase
MIERCFGGKVILHDFTGYVYNSLYAPTGASGAKATGNRHNFRAEGRRLMLPTEIVELLNQTTTSAVCDVLMRQGRRRYMRSRIRPLDPGVRLAGPALTIWRKSVELLPRNAERPRDRFVETIEGAAPGSVIVVVSDAEREAALWGGLLAAAGVRGKLGGVVADGPIRDPLEIIGLKFPIFCTGSVPAGGAGIVTLGAVNEPVSCGGVVVEPGDFVYGDSNGVVVIPAGMELDVLREAVTVEARDQEATKRILAGTGLLETMKSLGRA